MERFPGEVEELRAENSRLRKLLALSEQQARAAAADQLALGLTDPGQLTMASSPTDKVLFFGNLFRARTDVYAVRWENKRDGRSGWMPAISGRWHRRFIGASPVVHGRDSRSI